MQIIRDDDGFDAGRALAEQGKRERDYLRGIETAIQAADWQRLDDHFRTLLACVTRGWPRAMRRIAGLNGAPPEIREYFLKAWLDNGPHIRQETGDDILLTRALRVLLPPYVGPPVTLYRGESAWNRRHRTYGLSWSAVEEVADRYAQRARAMYKDSVVLRVDAPSKAILCTYVTTDSDLHTEQEYILDRRFIKGVTVLRRCGQLRP
jgi:hypothetical protein